MPLKPEVESVNCVGAAVAASGGTAQVVRLDRAVSPARCLAGVSDGCLVAVDSKLCLHLEESLCALGWLQTRGMLCVLRWWSRWAAVHFE